MDDVDARIATVEGHLEGPITLAGQQRVEWGDLVLSADGERVTFSAEVPLLPSGEPPDVAHAVEVPLAVSALWGS